MQDKKPLIELAGCAVVIFVLGWALGSRRPLKVETIRVVVENQRLPCPPGGWGHP